MLHCLKSDIYLQFILIKSIDFPLYGMCYRNFNYNSSKLSIGNHQEQILNHYFYSIVFICGCDIFNCNRLYTLLLVTPLKFPRNTGHFAHLLLNICHNSGSRYVRITFFFQVLQFLMSLTYVKAC